MILFFRSFLFSIGVVVLIAVQSVAAPLTPAEFLRFDATCRHFENRAHFMPRTEDSELVVRLADSCRHALSSLVGDHPNSALDTQKLSHAYLDRLTAYKSLYIRMIVLNGTVPGEMFANRSRQIRRIGLTRTGEYLIARRMGLLGAYDSWASASGFQITRQN
ncbi:MAG: hypothetical protein QNJ44_05850 [Rhodobacter sp.]|nr:hypothetical protein [Rhodobacter sp.]